MGPQMIPEHDMVYIWRYENWPWAKNIWRFGDYIPGYPCFLY